MLTLKVNDSSQTDVFPISVQRSDMTESARVSASNFCQIAIVLGGHASRAHGSDSRPVAAGDVFAVGRHETIAFHDIEDLRLIRILFCPERLHLKLLDLSGPPGYRALFAMDSSRYEGTARLESVPRLSPKELSIAVTYAETLARELEMKEPGSAFIAYAWFMQLVGYLSRTCSCSKNFNPRAQVSVRTAIAHLETHFDEPVNLDELSRLSHMSRRSFCRAFQAATGTTPMAYLGRLRLARAAAMLRRHEESVTSVAYKVGFNDGNYFTRRFHEMFGIPPSEYRKRQELI